MNEIILRKLKLNFIENLKKCVGILKLNTMETRRERFFIIIAWQQNEGIKENVFSLDIGRVGRRFMKLSIIPTVIDTRYKIII